jgi:hypothetical protein
VFGAVAIGCSNDPGLPTTIAPTFNSVMAQSHAVSTNLWLPAKLSTTFNPDWLYTGVDAADESSARLSCFAELTSGIIGLVSTTSAQFLGLIEMEVEFEFDNLIDSTLFNSTIPTPLVDRTAVCLPVINPISSSSSSSSPSSLLSPAPQTHPSLPDVTYDEPEQYVRIQPTLRRM